MDKHERALAYLKNLPMAISGSGGHGATFQAVLACRRFGLSEGEMWEPMQWFNANRCSPPWTEKELRHKISSAAGLNVTKPLGAPTRGRPSRLFVPPTLKRPARPAYVGQAPAAIVLPAWTPEDEEAERHAPDDGYWEFIEQDEGVEAEL